jgi:hypothetical protein
MIIVAIGALVAVGGSALRMPGSKKSMGETDVPVLMPLHPAPDNASVAKSANNMKFQCNFTLASIN